MNSPRLNVSRALLCFSVQHFPDQEGGRRHRRCAGVRPSPNGRRIPGAAACRNFRARARPAAYAGRAAPAGGSACPLPQPLRFTRRTLSDTPQVPLHVGFFPSPSFLERAVAYFFDAYGTDRQDVAFVQAFIGPSAPSQSIVGAGRRWEGWHGGIYIGHSCDSVTLSARSCTRPHSAPLREDPLRMPPSPPLTSFYRFLIHPRHSLLTPPPPRPCRGP